jgi:hypothetical protein
MTTATHTTARDESRNVRAWRFCALRRAGYPERAAAELAGRRDVDLHKALDLRVSGCPVETALAILR